MTLFSCQLRDQSACHGDLPPAYLVGERISFLQQSLYENVCGVAAISPHKGLLGSNITEPCTR